MTLRLHKVIKVDSYRYFKAHGDTLVLTLDCGHEVSRKASQGVPKRAVCPRCELGEKPLNSNYMASQHYKCANCELEIDITEDNKNFPYAEGWELIEDDEMVKQGLKPYWLCPKCARV